MKNIDNYFTALDKMRIDEIEVWRLLCRRSNYKTNIAGYTIQQLVVDADSRLLLTTSKVRTMLKKFEKEGWIVFLTNGTKGTESTLKLTIKQQLFSNDLANKSECLQGAEESIDNDLANNSQITRNTIKEKEKEKEIKKEKVTNLDKIINAYTQNILVVEAIKDFIKMRKSIKKPLTDRALKGILNKLDSMGKDDLEKIELLEQSIENCWASIYELKNKKATTGIVGSKNNSYNGSICKTSTNNSRKNDLIIDF